MSSAAKNERGRLEEEFQRRMQDAEASPSAAIWDRIDHQLTMQESSHYKSGMLFYRQLAAACVAILLLAGGLGAYYLGNASPERKVAQLQQPTATENIAAANAPAATPENTEATTEEAIAAAMHQAVRADQPSIGAAPAAIPATGESTARAQRSPAAPAAQAKEEENAATSITAENFALAPGAATTADPSIWHRKPDTGYNSFFNGDGSSAAQRLFSNFEEARKSNFGAPAGNSVAAAKPRASFAGTGATPAPTDDFRKLNELARHRAKELQREQETMVQALNEKKSGAEVKVVEENEENELSGDSRWTVGMAYMPSYFEQNIGIPSQMMGGISYDSFAPPSLSTLRQTNTYMADAREEYQEEIEPGFSFGVEVKTGFKLGKKWKLLSGLGFTQNTARSKSSYVIEQFEEKPGTNQKVSPGPTTIFLSSLHNNYGADSMSVARTDAYGVTYRYRHLTVPAGIQYEGKISEDWFWFAGGGVAANILIESAVLASNAEVRDKEYARNDDDSPFRKLQWSGNVTAGLGKRLSNNISVAVGPEYRAYLNSMLANPGTTQAPQGKPYTIGLNMAVNYDLGPGNR